MASKNERDMQTLETRLGAVIHGHEGELENQRREQAALRTACSSITRRARQEEEISALRKSVQELGCDRRASVARVRRKSTG